MTGSVIALPYPSDRRLTPSPSSRCRLTPPRTAKPPNPDQREDASPAPSWMRGVVVDARPDSHLVNPAVRNPGRLWSGMQWICAARMCRGAAAALADPFDRVGWKSRCSGRRKIPALWLEPLGLPLTLKQSAYLCAEYTSGSYHAPALPFDATRFELALAVLDGPGAEPFFTGPFFSLTPFLSDDPLGAPVCTTEFARDGKCGVC